ncbi:MAG: Rrf2 family transcriptional regulator [Myxococcales bacterium]|nr:Rrf2 family transcriptional regulator [Myxococcales bacterium]
MTANTHFAVALHALSVLAYRGEVTSSDVIAQSVSTNPVVVRRAMGKLVKAGIVRSVPGKHGGFELARPAKRIRLVEVFDAVTDDSTFRIHDNAENPRCAVSCGIKGVLSDVLERVDGAVRKELSKSSLADVVSQFS